MSSGRADGDRERDDNAAEALRSAAEAERALFIAQMRARFELDQEQAELENRQKNG